MGKFIYIFIISITFFLELKAQNQSQVSERSLNLLLSRIKTTEGEEKVRILNQIAEIYANSQPVKARNYAQEAIDLARDLDFEEGEAQALKNVGIIYQLQGNYSQALEYFLNALRIYEKLKDQAGVAKILNNIGIVYQSQKKYPEARKYYERVLELDKQTQDKRGEASTLNNLGDIFYQQDKYEQALTYYENSLYLREKINDSLGIAVSLKNIGLVNYVQNNYKAALAYFTSSLNIDTRLGNKTGISSTDLNIANAYLKSEKIDSALYFATKSYESASAIGLDRERAEACLTLAEIYTLKNDYKPASEYQTEYITIQEFIFNDGNTKKIEVLQTSYELEKKQLEAKLANEWTFYTILASTIIITLLFAFAFVLYRSYINQRRANDLLTQQNYEINQQKEEIMAQRDLIEDQLKEIEIKNAEITEKNINIESSIRYALTIQQAILPKPKTIDEILPLNFIFYRPRDVVSGDFYWFHHIPAEHPNQKGKAIISAIDCTGHGVPGAFMSMIGDSLLNQIIIDHKIRQSHLILNQLHKGVREALEQKETHNRDGMDMALCIIDFDAKTLEFSGAKNSLIYIKNHQLHEVKAGVYSVGGWEDDDSEPVFHSEVISFADAPITFYIYSDGFQDQFGGPKGKKFMRSQLKSLLFDIHREPMTYQEEILADTFEAWKGDLYQVDDVLVIGMRIG